MKRVRCGIVGFGFIGPHHAEAIRRLGFVDVVAVSSNEVDAARQKAARLGIPKVYETYQEVIADPEVEVVDVVTPTRFHHPVAMAAIRAGKHVIVDKPLAVSRAQALEMRDAARAAGVVNAVTFNYRYNPVVQHARAAVARGAIGAVRLMRGQYLQEWLLYETDYSWRLDPEMSGAAAMVADAGCHWFDLAEYVTGLRVTSVLADLATLIPVRKKPSGGAREAFAAAGDEKTEDYQVVVPDYGAVLLKFSNGARGCFTTSPLCAGHKNDLRLELNGSKASLEWVQERPNELWIGHREQPNQVLLKDPPLLDESVRHYAALPGGHNEAWPDAFKNTMAGVFERILAGGKMTAEEAAVFPTFDAGLRAAAIAEALVESHRRGAWVDVTG